MLFAFVGRHRCCSVSIDDICCTLREIKCQFDRIEAKFVHSSFVHREFVVGCAKISGNRFIFNGSCYRITMENCKTCKKCSISIDNRVDLFTVCEGDCACLFHANCVGLSEKDLDVFSNNVIWMCDTCVDKFRKAREGILPVTVDETDTEKSLEEDVKELKCAVAGILDSLSKMMPITTSASNINLLHSTSVSPFSLSAGANESDADRHAENLQRSKNTTNSDNADDTFSLFLSNIDPCVTECDIHGLVSRALGTTEPERNDVIKLTKYWNGRRPDFISFKIIVNKKWKSRALDPLTWPVNIKFREFVNVHNNTWRPTL